MTGKKLVDTNQYTDEQRRTAVVLYMTLGNMNAVSERTGIPHNTLADWKNHSDWWHVVADDARQQVGDEIKAEILATMRAAYTEVRERLENGDHKVVDKRVQRVPVSARDAGWLAAVLTDKWQVLNNQPTSISSSHLDARLAEAIEAVTEIGRKARERVIEGASHTVEGSST